MTDVVVRAAVTLLTWLAATLSLACDNTAAASKRAGDAPPPARPNADRPPASGLEEALLDLGGAHIGEEREPCRRDGRPHHYGEWTGLRPFGVATAPVDLDSRHGPLDFVVHFHGQLAALMELDAARADLALVGVSFEQGTYESHLVQASSFSEWLDDARTKLPEARLASRPLALTAWSNGYEAIRHLLLMNAEEAEAIVLLDGLHAAEPDDVGRTQLAPFVAWARRAARGDRFLFVSHSTIPTYGYASTRESVDLLLDELGVDLAPFDAPRLGGAAPSRALHQGGLFIVGYEGVDRDAHCRHLALLMPALELARAWDGTR